MRRSTRPAAMTASRLSRRHAEPAAGEILAGDPAGEAVEFPLALPPGRRAGAARQGASGEDPGGDDATGPVPRPSKSHLKREMHGLQKLGVMLVELGEGALARIEMPERLRGAIEAARRTRSHEGRRRQLQYVGKLMRNDDVDAPRLRAAYDRVTGASREEALRLRKLELLRAQLMADDQTLAALRVHYPEVDFDPLPGLVRAARFERGQGQGGRAPVRHARSLFRWLRDQLPAQLRQA